MGTIWQCLLSFISHTQEFDFSRIYQKKHMLRWAQWLMPEILATREAGIGRTKVGGQLGQKVETPISTNKAGCGGMYLSLQSRGKYKWRTVVQVSPSINVRPIPKITEAKRSGGSVTLAVEHLLASVGVLSSNPSTSKKKKNTNKKETHIYGHHGAMEKDVHCSPVIMMKS
jgi:hypothetical protein